MGGLANNWFVCQTKVREENRARHYLEEKGFDVYLPLMETHVTLGTMEMLVKKPLFPSYLFVRVKEEEEIPYIRWTRGVRKILTESVRPVALEDKVMEAVRALAQKDGIVRKKALRKNDRVRILRGPFRDFYGIFDEWNSDKGRVRVLLRCINFGATLDIHHTLVEKVDSEEPAY